MVAKEVKILDTDNLVAEARAILMVWLTARRIYCQMSL